MKTKRLPFVINKFTKDNVGDWNGLEEEVALELNAELKERLQDELFIDWDIESGLGVVDEDDFDLVVEMIGEDTEIGILDATDMGLSKILLHPGRFLSKELLDSIDPIKTKGSYTGDL